MTDTTQAAGLTEDDSNVHMYPSDLEKFSHGEHTATAFSIPVASPAERSVPLFTLEQVRAALAAQAVPAGGFRYFFISREPGQVPRIGFPVGDMRASVLEWLKHSAAGLDVVTWWADGGPSPGTATVETAADWLYADDPESIPLVAASPAPAEAKEEPDMRTPDQMPTIQSSLKHGVSLIGEILSYHGDDIGPSLSEQCRIFLELSDEALATPQPQAAQPVAVIAAKLAAMAINYTRNHSWDHLDAEVCTQAAALLRTTPQPRAARPAIEGWITWWPAMGGGHKPVYSHGNKKPGYGAELDALLKVYPVYTAAPALTGEQDAFPALQTLTEAILTRADADYMRRQLDEAVRIMGTRGWSPPVPYPAALRSTQGGE
ncbi:hypothetical protein SAMN05216359_105335 [Roseateles sp. YR242]|uniref:hypothetical protein n=1 Tax=Roseateles sp. YR242 TaxID=1855305 RepID=UPI0008D0EC86|nr:hypothetical protein [Roseateles sp. YR242]SEL13745.1 hypothetical protein SAMN05216359_105335 [Roseateles sp. YR242]